MPRNDRIQPLNVPLYGVVDERTKAAANQGDAYTARFVLFALLFDVVLRGLGFGGAFVSDNWDLMLIVFVGGMISTVYQIQAGTMFTRPSSRSFTFVAILMGASAAVAIVAATLFGR